jgi:hypothetical protein
MYDFSFRADQQANRNPEDSLEPECPHKWMHKSIEEGVPEVMYCIYCGKSIPVDEFEEA